MTMMFLLLHQPCLCSLWDCLCSLFVAHNQWDFVVSPQKKCLAAQPSSKALKRGTQVQKYSLLWISCPTLQHWLGSELSGEVFWFNGSILSPLVFWKHEGRKRFLINLWKQWLQFCCKRLGSCLMSVVCSSTSLAGTQKQKCCQSKARYGS